MDKTNAIRLTGHADEYRLDEDAYARLTRYLDQASVRLQDDPERAEVLGDLERSVGDRLSTLVATGDRLVTAADIDGILEEIGAVDTGDTGTAGRHQGSPAAGDPGRRRLRRIKEGQQIFGVCNGLAAYADLSVDWVRTIFFFAALLTAGLFTIVYIVMAFILPVVPTREAYDRERA